MKKNLWDWCKTTVLQVVWTAHDWIFDDDLRNKPLSSTEIKLVTANVGWTNELHERMEKKFPRAEQNWFGFDKRNR